MGLPAGPAAVDAPGGRRHPRTWAAVEVNFDGITYAKGASVLKQLVAYVGLEEFLAGLRDYFRDHAFGNATFGDLLGALEKASGRDLSGWGQQWLKTTGLNTLRADFDVDADAVHPVRHQPERRGARRRRNPRAPAGGRRLRRRRLRQAGADAPRGARRRGATSPKSLRCKVFRAAS